jgi:beta-N-acetylhexosaminidase
VRAVYLRRRLIALAVLAAVVLAVVQLASGDDSRPRSPAPAPTRAAGALPLREQVGEVVLMRFNGHAPPAYVRRILRERRATGVTLFAENVATPAQLRGLDRRLQRAARGEALIAVDQEGGSARRLPWASRAGQPSLATPRAAAAAARGTARALRSAGVTLNFAPVVDVASGAGSELAGRAYPGGSSAVAASGAAAVRAYRGTRVAPTVKHFPGFGRARTNTDDGAVTIRATRAQLAADLAPFRSAVAAGAPVVMVSHALYPAYDGAWIASQSRTIVDGLLRGRLGFGGVVATDSMEADAVLARSDVGKAAVLAVYAGCDLVVLTGRGSQRPVYNRLLAEARRSPYFRSRLEAAAGRVLALKRRLGLRTP